MSSGLSMLSPRERKTRCYSSTPRKQIESSSRNDERIPAIAEQWLGQERRFRGLIIWKRRHHHRMTDGDIIRAIEALAERENPFAYAIVYLKPESDLH